MFSRRFADRPAAACVLASLTLLVVVATTWAYPKPSTVPYRWELDYKAGALRLYVDPGTDQAYWYTTYKVINNTGRDQVWAPEFTLFTDRGGILRAGANVPRRVTNDLLKLMGNKFLEPQGMIIGEILQGEQHAREGLVVWKPNEMEVNEIAVFIAGISGETAGITMPDGSEYILRKTLQRDYLVPGDIRPRGSLPVPLKKEHWVLR